jgi:hypothetical protein
MAPCHRHVTQLFGGNVSPHPSVLKIIRARKQCLTGARKSASKSTSKPHYGWRPGSWFILLSIPVCGSSQGSCYCLTFVVFVGRPIWGEVGSVACQSYSAAVSSSYCTKKNEYLHLTCLTWYESSHIYTVYTRPVQARYSKVCHTSGSSRYCGSLDISVVASVAFIVYV